MLRHSRSISAFLGLCFGLINTVHAATPSPETPREWLDAMAWSAHNQNYSGTFTFLNNGTLQSMRLIHGHDDTLGERDRLISLSGSQREVLRDSEHVTCIISDTQSVKVDHGRQGRPIPLVIPTQLDRIGDYYEFIFAGDERVAGRSSRKVMLVPRDAHRYSHAVWIDHQSHLLLRSELLNEHKQPVEQLIFNDITLYSSPPEQLLTAQSSGEDYVWYRTETSDDDASAAKQSSKSEWNIGFLPEGFELDVQRFNSPSKQHRAMEQRVFSDGLASISIFIEPYSDGDVAFLGSSTLGAVNARGRILAGHHLTVVGEVPGATIDRVADSIHYLGGE